MRGTVKWFDIVKGYGFITNEDGKDVFIHYSDIDNEKKFKKLETNDKVVFNIETDENGLERASAVENRMYELIEKKLSTLENAELRYSLEQVFRALSDRQDRISNELMDRLVREKSSGKENYDEKWTVATVLVKDNEIARYAVEGFSVIDVGKCYYKKQDFVDLGLENSNTGNQSYIFHFI